MNKWKNIYVITEDCKDCGGKLKVVSDNGKTERVCQCVKCRGIWAAKYVPLRRKK